MSIFTVQKQKDRAFSFLPDFSKMKGVEISFDPKQALRACLRYVRNAMSYIANLPLLNKVVRQDSQASDAVIKRLSRMKETHGKKEQAMSVDPFRRTFLEKTRESLECGSSYDNHEHMLRTKLQWFAGSEWSKHEIEHVVDKALKTSQRQILKASLKNTNPGAENFPHFTPVFETVTIGPNPSLQQAPEIIRDSVLQDDSSSEQTTNLVEFSKPNFVILENENPLDCLLDLKALEALAAPPLIRSVSEVRATALAAAASSESVSDSLCATTIETVSDSLCATTFETVSDSLCATTIETVSDSLCATTIETVSDSLCATTIETVSDSLCATTIETVSDSLGATTIESLVEQPELSAASTSYIEASIASIEYGPASITLIETGVDVVSTVKAVQYSAAASANLELLNYSITANETDLSASSIEATLAGAQADTSLSINLVETMLECSAASFALDDSVVARTLDTIITDLNWDEKATNTAIEDKAEVESHPYKYEDIYEELLDFAPELPLEIICAPEAAEFLVDSSSAVSLKFAALEGEISLPTHIAEDTKTAILENLGAGINLSTTQVSLRVSQEIAQQAAVPEADFSITIISPEPSAIEVEQPKLSSSTALMGRVSSTSLICLKARSAAPVVEILEAVETEIECEIAVVKFVDQASQRMRMLFAVHDLSLFASNGSFMRSTNATVPIFASTYLA